MISVNPKIAALESAWLASQQKLGALVASGAADEKITHQKQIEARRKAVYDTAVAAEKASERKAETRRQILKGRLLDRMNSADPQLKLRAFAELDSYLTRPDDRALFGLEPLPVEPQSQPADAPVNQWQG